MIMPTCFVLYTILINSYLKQNDTLNAIGIQMENSMNCFSCTWFSCACWLCIFFSLSCFNTHTETRTHRCFVVPRPCRQHILMGQWSRCNSNTNKHTWILVCFLLISKVRCMFVRFALVGERDRRLFSLKDCLTERHFCHLWVYLQIRYTHIPKI